MPISALPTAPTRADPANFSTRADAFLAALSPFQSEANSLQADVTSKQAAATSSATASANSAVTAGNSATAAANSAASAAASAGVTAWAAGTNYAIGVNVYDTTDFLTYRRKVAGTTAPRPGSDAANWQLIAGDATLANAQTFTGVKTFTQTIVGTIQNANIAASLSDGTVICPVAMMTFYFGSSAPAGWLKANGAAVSRTTYANLFAAIGTGYGAGDGSTTFNVPDLRGEFIRAWDDGRTVDNGRTFGSFQGGTIESHSHGVGSLATASSGAHTHTLQLQEPSSGGSTGVAVGGPQGATIGTSSAGAHTHTITGSTAAAGSPETRPRNIALLACIKF